VVARPASEPQLGELNRLPCPQRLLCCRADRDSEGAVAGTDVGLATASDRREEAEVLVVGRAMVRAGVADRGIERERLRLVRAAVAATDDDGTRGDESFDLALTEVE